MNQHCWEHWEIPLDWWSAEPINTSQQIFSRLLSRFLCLPLKELSDTVESQLQLYWIIDESFHRRRMTLKGRRSWISKGSKAAWGLNKNSFDWWQNRQLRICPIKQQQSLFTLWQSLTKEANRVSNYLAQKMEKAAGAYKVNNITCTRMSSCRITSNCTHPAAQQIKTCSSLQAPESSDTYISRAHKQQPVCCGCKCSIITPGLFARRRPSFINVKIAFIHRPRLMAGAVR